MITNDAVTEDQIVRFLMELPQETVSQIFQTVSEENPERAGSLMRRILKDDSAGE